MSSGVMPPEIIDWTIDHLGTEQETLKLCSTFVVSSENILPFLELLESPYSTLPTSLRALTIWQDQTIPMAHSMELSLQKLCGALRAIEWFTLDTVDWWALQPASKYALMSLLANVPEVHFDRVDFDTRLELIGVIYNLPSLKALSVTRIPGSLGRHRSIDAIMTPLPDRLPSLHLRSLTVELDDIGYAVLEWLKKNKAFPKCLEQIEIPSVCFVLDELLTLLGPQLKCIRLKVNSWRLDDLRLAISESGCEKLESLELIKLALDPDTTGALVRLFSEYAMHSPRLRELNLHCVVLDPYSTRDTFPKLAHLDMLLSSPRFASLQTLKLIVANMHPGALVSAEDRDGWEPLRVLREAILKCLPLCHQRGILLSVG